MKLGHPYRLFLKIVDAVSHQVEVHKNDYIRLGLDIIKGSRNGLRRCQTIA